MTQAHTTGQERALKEALKPFATAWTVWSDLKVLKPESEHVQRGPQGAVLASDFKRAHEVLSALPHQPATDEGEAAEWAREWHRCVETILTMAGLSPALGASEAALAMQEYITRVEATPTSHPPAAETRLRAAVIEECAKVADVKGEESADGSMTQWAFFDAAHAIRALALTQPEPTAQQGEVCSACLGENKAQGEYRCLQCNGTGLAKDNAFSPAAPQGGEE